MLRRDWMFTYRFAILFVVVATLYAAIFVHTFIQARHAGVSAEEFIVVGSDATEYVSLARTMLDHGRFALSESALPETFRLPGYPAFLAALFFLFHTVFAIPLAQILLGALNACLAAAIGERYFSRWVALGAAALFAIEPVAMTHTFIALSETLFVTLFLLTTFILVRDEASPRAAFLGGVILGAAIFVRSTGLYCAPLFALWLIWTHRRYFRTALLAVVAFCVGLAIVTVPWMMRNHIVQQHFALTTVGSLNLAFTNAVFFESYRTGRSEADLREEIFTRLGTRDDMLLRTFGYADKEKKLAKAYILAHPFSYALFHFGKTIPFFVGSGLDNVRGILRTRNVSGDVNVSNLIFRGDIRGAFTALLADPLSFFLILAWCVVSLLAALSLPLSWFIRRPAFPFVLFSLLLIGTLGFITAAISMPRYRIPAEPFMFLLAFEAVYLVYLKWYRRTKMS